MPPLPPGVTSAVRVVRGLNSNAANIFGYFGSPSTGEFSVAPSGEVSAPGFTEPTTTVGDGIATVINAAALGILDAVPLPRGLKTFGRSIVRKITGVKRKEASKSFSSSAGVEECWIGPKGYRARKRRRHEELVQARLLEQAVNYGTGDPTTGPSYFSVPERVQQYTWCDSASFTTGWPATEADTKTGECSYKITAPFCQQFVSQLRANVRFGDEFVNSITNAVGVWEANAIYHVRCNTTDPSELTIWQLWPKEDIPSFREPDDDKVAWFPIIGTGTDAAALANSHGIFRYVDNTAAGATAPNAALVPTFDASTGLGTGPSPTVVTTNLPVCMQRCFDETTIESPNLASNANFTAHDYYNTPQDFKALSENFDIKPVYKRWFNPGDTSILHCSIPYSFQMRHEYENMMSPLPTASANSQPIADEKFWAWRKKYGPLYLWRIRGNVVYDSKEVVLPAAVTPGQHINFGSALLDIVSHYEVYMSHIPYPAEYFNYRSSATNLITTMDNIAFADQQHIAPVAPAAV